MSQSPMSPVGKRLRTMSSNGSTEQQRSLSQGTRQLVNRNAGESQTRSQGTSTGLDVAGQLIDDTPGPSGITSPVPISPPTAASIDTNPRSGIPADLFYGPTERPQSDPTRDMQNRGPTASVNRNHNQPHYDEVIDELLPLPVVRQRNNGNREVRVWRADRLDRRDPELLGPRDDRLMVLVNFFPDESIDSDASSQMQGFARDFNQEDFELDDSFDDDEVNDFPPEVYLKYDPTPDTPYPKPDWITIRELRARKYGFASSRRQVDRSNMFWFQRHARNSLWMIQRLQLDRSLKIGGHSSCVNSLDFSNSTSLLCSGGDDLTVCLWDWQKPKESNHLRAKINTGHTSNVFQTVFCNLDQNIVTSSRDGSVRLIDIKTSHSTHLMSSNGEIGKLTFIEPNTFLTCGTNANVNLVDLRTERANKLFTVRNPKNNRTCPLHSIDSHPIDKNMIAVAGSSPYVFLYDLRRLPRESYDTEMKPKNCLGVMGNSNLTVTSTAFNSNGDKLLVSYNYDHLYVFKTESCEQVHKYEGHRNKRTIKGCAWFGDNYVLSGSDDGHIYGWDLESEHIVCFLHGDKRVVNVLCVHPNLPILATAGLDHDVKIFEPTSDTWPQTMKGIKPQICKNTLLRKRAFDRHSSPATESDSFEGDDDDDDDDDDEDDDNDDDDDDDGEDEELEDYNHREHVSVRDADDDDDSDDNSSGSGEEFSFPESSPELPRLPHDIRDIGDESFGSDDSNQSDWNSNSGIPDVLNEGVIDWVTDDENMEHL